MCVCVCVYSFQVVGEHGQHSGLGFKSWQDQAVAGKFSSPGSTFCAEAYFSILPHPPSHVTAV